MFQKIVAGVTLLTCLSLWVAAAPVAEHGAKKPYRTAKHARSQKDHRLAKAVKSSIRRAGPFDEFSRQKGRLAWPLSGTVSMAFGRHEYIRGIIHDNQSATIDCAEGSVAKAVYAGEVTAVMDMQGVWCVILKHGSYYTAYSNLATTRVAQGDRVQAGEPLGCVGDTGQLEFMLADGEGRFYDPQVWLKR